MSTQFLEISLKKLKFEEIFIFTKYSETVVLRESEKLLPEAAFVNLSKAATH